MWVLWATMLPGLAISQYVAREQNQPGGSGSPACPCIDPWVDIGVSTLQCRNVTYMGRHECIPLNYGASSCHAWDDNLGPCAEDAGADISSRIAAGLGFCASAWCYVDAAHCERHPKRSTMSLNDGVADPGLSYSYETCGNLDDYSPSKQREALLGRRLRVSYPGDSGSGYTLKTVGAGRGWHGKDGSMVAFMHAIAADVGFSLEYHEVSNSSKIQVRERLGSGSSFTRCVHEVAINETDLCIGNFWMTNERLLMTTFSGSVYDDIMKLVARTDLHQAKGDVWDEFVEHLKTPFRPLTPGAWALIFATIIVAGFGLSFIEPSALAFEWRQVTPEVLNESIQSQEDDGVQLEWQVPDATFADRMNVRCGIPIFHIVSKKLTELVGSMYYGSLGLIAGSPIHESDSMPGRLLTVGFGFFCLVCLSSYTASLATLLMMANQRVSTITSLDDVIASGEPLCIRGAMLDNFLATYPEFDQTKLLAFDTQSDCSLDVRGCQDGLIDAGDQMLNALDAEKCVGVVIFSDAWESKKRSGFHCNKAAVNNLFGVPNGMPIREEIVEPLSFLIASAKAAGDYSRYEKSYMRRFLPPPYACGVESAFEYSENGPMGVDHLLGPFLIFSLCLACAIGVFCGCGYMQTHNWHNTHLTETETIELKEQLQGLKPSALVERAYKNLHEYQSMQGNELTSMTSVKQPTAHTISSAIDRFPALDKLIQVIIEQEGSYQSKQVFQLHRSSISTLYKIAMCAIPDDAPEQVRQRHLHDINKCLDGQYHSTEYDDKPKEALVVLLLDILDHDGDGNIDRHELAKMVAEVDSQKLDNPLWTLWPSQGGTQQ